MTAYLVVKDHTSTGQSLVAWQPFVAGRADILFQRPTGTGVGALQGASVLAEVPLPGLNGYLFLAGSQRGEVFSARLGSRTLAYEAQSNLRSALAVSPPANVAVDGDTIGYVDGNGNFTLATVEGESVRGLGDQANTQFFWIKPWQYQPTGRFPVWIFRTSVAAPPNQVTVDPVDPAVVTFQSGVPVPSHIAVLELLGVFISVEIAVDPMTQVVTVDPAFPSTAVGDSVDYWAPTELQAAFYPALVLSSVNSGSWTTDALRDGSLHFPDLTPSRQSVIAYQEDGQHHPLRLVLGTAWQVVPPFPANFRLAVDSGITSWAQVLGDFYRQSSSILGILERHQLVASASRSGRR